LTKDILLAYINRKKAKAGTWAALAAKVEPQLNMKQLQMVAAGKRDPDKRTLAAFGVVETTKQTYKFSAPSPPEKTA
jgi:hypothetical protein